MKAYCGVSHEELSLTKKQVKMYYGWRKHNGFTVKGQRPDYEPIEDESDEQYHQRVWCEENMEDYLYLKFVVKYILSRHGYLSNDEIWTWVDGTGGHNVVISTHGRVFRTMYYSSKRGYPVKDRSDNIRGVFALHPGKRQMEFTITSPTPVKGFTPSGGFGGYRNTFYLFSLMKDYFTKEQVAKCMGQDAADFICCEGRRPSRFRTDMTIQSVETGEVLKFKSKKEIGDYFGISKEAVVMAIKRGSDGRFRLKRKEFIIIEDYKREGKNVNAQPGHTKKGKKKREMLKRRENKKMVTRINNYFKKDNKNVWKRMVHTKGQREKALLLLGSSSPYEFITSKMRHINEYDAVYVKQYVKDSYCQWGLIDEIKAEGGLRISDEEWCNRLTKLVMETKAYEDECRRKEEKAAKCRKYYGRKAWRERTMYRNETNAHAADILY